MWATFALSIVFQSKQISIYYVIMDWMVLRGARYLYLQYALAPYTTIIHVYFLFIRTQFFLCVCIFFKCYFNGGLSVLKWNAFYLFMHMQFIETKLLLAIANTSKSSLLLVFPLNKVCLIDILVHLYVVWVICIGIWYCNLYWLFVHDIGALIEHVFHSIRLIQLHKLKNIHWLNSNKLIQWMDEIEGITIENFDGEEQQIFGEQKKSTFKLPVTLYKGAIDKSVICTLETLDTYIPDRHFCCCLSNLSQFMSISSAY